MGEGSEPVVPTSEVDGDRRDFIQKAGKFALVAPPAITFLLTTSLTSTAIAQSSQNGPRPNYRPTRYRDR